MFFSILNLIIVFGLIFAGLWFAKKKLGSGNWTQISSKGYVRVIDEGVQMGLNQKISVIKIGDELIVHSVGSAGVSMLKLDQTNLKDPKENFDSLLGEDNKELVLKGKIKELRGKFNRNG